MGRGWGGGGGGGGVGTSIRPTRMFLVTLGMKNIRVGEGIFNAAIL